MDAKKKKNLEETYKRILNVGFCLIPYEDLSDIIAPEPMVFGTAKDERIHSYEGIEALFKAQLEQIGDMKPSIDRKRITLRISKDGNQAIIVEEITLTLSSPEVTHTIFMRASCVMEYLDNRWKLSHWHTSTPVETENDPWHLEEWKREKEKLQQLVDEQTAALKQNNRELQIEAALEKVRSRSLAMYHSSELSAVVDTLMREFTSLEFTLTFCIINLIDEQDMSNTVWAANPETGKDPESYYMKFEDYPFHHAMWDAWKAQKKRFVYTLEGEEKKLYDEYLYTDTEFRRFPKNVQEANKALERYVAGFTFFKYSGLQTVSVNSISENELEILERFGRVFEQAYTRFLDLKKAEAQAREAQIEAALEKVRSRSMAMHNSQELKEVALELRKQMGLLGQKDLEVCAIHLYGNDEDSFESWSAMKASGSETEIVQTQAHFPKRGIRIVDEMMHHYTIGTKDYVLLNEGEKITEWFKVLKKHAPELHTSILDSIGKVPVNKLKANWAVADFSGGALVMVTYGEPDELSRNLLRRSANVFEQAYVRFLDLKKAEEQARESQIEVSLERVRSKALAMHNSEDLRQTITAIFEELKGLNIKTIRLGLGLVNPDRPEGEMFTSRIDEKDQILEVSAKLRLEGHPVIDSIYDHFKQQQDYFPILEGEEIRSYYAALQGSVNVQGQGTDTKHFGCFLYFKEGCLYAWSAEPHSEEQIDILKKFSRVVEITYRRYIELQKAEEQAKEAQIEASLERIRAKAMAMHQSDELDEVLAVLCEQFDTLGIFPMSTHMTVLDIANNKFTFRETGKFGNRSFGEQTVALDAMDTWKDMVESWKSAEPYSINRLHFPKETLPQVWEIFHESFASMPEGSKITPDDYPDGIYHTAGKHPFGYIGMNQVRPATEKEEQIVVKFANEFGRAYQRFLDLQKAEAQAREAQIVASMERVRAATMAMHQSNELSLVLSKLFEQFDVLGIKPSHAVLTLIDKEKNTLNFRTTGKNGYQVLAEQEVDLNVMNAWVDTAEKWKKSNPNTVNVNEFPPEILPEVWEVYKDILASIPKKARPEIKDFPDGLFITEGYCRFGYIGFAHHRKPTEEEKDIVRRIAAEFGTLYQRFLDLKKSEAQAREAQIETALEKVRSRTMAMQKGDELQEVAVLLYKELIALGVENFVSCGYVEIHESTQKQHVWITSPGGDTMGLFYLPLTGDATFDARYAAWKKQQIIFHQTVAGDVRSNHLEYAITTFNSKEAEEMVLNQFPDPTVFYCFNFSHGYLHLVGGSLLEKEEEVLLARFTKVFEQTYTRFLDLQKAEAQAREAKIETALEKVRSRTMGMQSSDELPEVANLLFTEVRALGINAWSCGYNILSEDKKTATCCMSSEGTLQTPFQLRLWGEVSFDEMGDFIQSDENMLVQELSDKAIEEHYAYMKSFPDLKPTFDEIDRLGLSLPTYQINHLCKFNQGFILFITYEKVPDAHDIFKRFTKVFDQTYTRFLDLQKSEAQTREAQINLAVERLRAKALAMHKSEEIMDVVAKLKDEVMGLDIPDVVAATIFLKEGEDKVRMWDLSTLEKDENGYQIPFDITFKLKKTDPHLYVKRVWDNPENYFQEKQETKEFKRIIAWLKENDQTKVADDVETFINETQLKCLHHAVKKLNNGKLVIDLLGEPSNEMETILTKMGAAFDLAYKRFEDLQKAEAQAKEAKIEVALEKVRSRTMGMQKSDELADVANVLFQEMNNLVHNLWTCGFVLCEKDRQEDEWWLSLEDGFSRGFFLPNVNDYAHSHLYEGWLKKDDFRTVQLEGDDLQAHYDWLMKIPIAKSLFDEMEAAGMQRPEWQKLHGAYFSKGYLVIITREPCGEEAIFKRFAQVFDLTYTRFLDLQKAEAQAREAQIENALEKVRSRSLAMQSPNELIEVAHLLREEMGALGVEALETSSIYIQDENQDTTQCWFTIKDKDYPDNSVSDQMTIDLKETWVGRKMEAFYRSSEKQTSIVMKGDHRKEWMAYCERQSHLFSATKFYGDTIPERSYHLYKFSDGFIGAASPGDISVESWDLLRRATAVFSFAYTRFRDLKIAEASARAALRQASLDRVRADISSMRSAKDLERITPLVFNELTTLGIPFIRCGVFIVDIKQKQVEVYLSSPQGKSLAVMNLPFGANEMTKQSVKAWEQQQVYSAHWNKDDFVNWSKSLQEQGYVKDLNTYQGDQAAPESLHLHFIPFNQGLLYVGAGETLNDEQIDLVKALSESFAIAYARFEDFVKLEKAKAEVEVSMNELKATQSQLIQSEKMASLGELTAGIAHEIQNPLNFVNNFSEVSKELIDEMLEELQNGNMEDVREIMKDVIQNLEKINHHGKRADGIVKGMLQHSRSNSGTKEPTDINALCDEYLRLSYHGLRAKDKSFNATLHTDFEDDLDKVNVIPQDLGRVVLNLLTNAFYAVNERKQQNPTDYEPSVSIATKTVGKYLEITVKDNGNGMPQHVVDKIFQPFFTTKPTGQGTGLGLSMSYDIVTKGHGGELKVDTKYGQGTLFTIRLPRFNYEL